MSFPNLGKDAVLVCPVPAVQKPVYAHLALFVNNAPDAQVKGNEVWIIFETRREWRFVPLFITMITELKTLESGYQD